LKHIIGVGIPFMSKKQIVCDYFDNCSSYLSVNAITELRKDIVYQFLGDIKDKRIIDIGCGNGSISLPYLGLNHVTFLDVSKNMLEKLKKQIPEHLEKRSEIVHGGIDEFEPTDSYDIVLLMGVLAHIDDVDGCLKKVSSYLNRDGICIAQITDSQKLMTKIVKIYHRIRDTIFKPKSCYQVNKLNESDSISAFARNGLYLTGRKKYLPLFPGFRLIPKKNRRKFLFFCNSHKIISDAGSEVVFRFIKK
jgi:2-polyprenyl-3-methyl-5-hydroxy-6-metoxy-1,4-benzoquinol methylase